MIDSCFSIREMRVNCDLLGWHSADLLQQRHSHSELLLVAHRLIRQSDLLGIATDQYVYVRRRLVASTLATHFLAYMNDFSSTCLQPVNEATCRGALNPVTYGNSLCLLRVSQSCDLLRLSWNIRASAFLVARQS